MKQLILITLLSISALCFTQNANAQSYEKATLITTANDTLKGLILYEDWERNPKVIQYQRSEKSVIKEFTPADLLVFKVAGEQYYSKKVSIDKSSEKIDKMEKENKGVWVEEQVFLRSYAMGSKNLYYYKDENFKYHFFIESDGKIEELVNRKYIQYKDNGANYVKEYKQYIGQLNKYFQDCPKVLARINSLPYRSKEMTQIFENYNNCKGDNSYVSANSKLGFQWSVIAGLNASTLFFRIDDPMLTSLYPGLTGTNFGYSIRPTVGIGLNIILPRNLRKWSVYNDLLYKGYRLEKEFHSYTSDNYYSDHSYRLSNDYIKLSHLLRYQFATPKLKAFLNAGFSNGWAFKKHHLYIEKEQFYTQESYSEKPILSNMKTHELGFLAGAGITYNRVSCELRAEVGNGVTNHEYIYSATNSYTLLLSYQLNKGITKE